MADGSSQESNLKCLSLSLSLSVTTSLSISVLGPQDLRLVQLTDVSLLVEWESVRGAEYYILTYHPKDDKSALEQVGFCFSFLLYL